MASPERQKTLPGQSPKTGPFKEFYKTERGQFLDSEIGRSLAVNWNKKALENCHVLVVGYPAPSLLKVLKKGESLGVLFPKGQGKKQIQFRGKNVSLMGDPAKPPFLKGSYNAAFVFHSLEYMGDPQSFLEEIWRILTPDGKIMVMVPNKTGGWKRSGIPGQEKLSPLSHKAVIDLLQGAGFSPGQSYGIFYGLPVGYFRKLFFSKILKTLSGGSMVGFPGFMIFEAEKTVGPTRIKFKDPVKVAPGVKTAPEFIPE